MPDVAGSSSVGEPDAPAGWERPVIPRSVFRVVRPLSSSVVGRTAVPVKWGALPYARFRRRRLDRTRVVCVTGSIGKTTTTHMLQAALASPPTSRAGSNRAKATVRSIRASSGRDFLVEEIGANGPGSLDELLWTLEPDVSVVTAVASDHFGAFRSLDAVAHEKAKAVACLPPNGLAVLNADDPRVLAMRAFCRGRVVTFGESAAADVRISDVHGSYPDGIAFRAETPVGTFDVPTRLVGRHLAGCAAAALACAIALGRDPSDALAAIASAPPVPHRLSILEIAGGPTFLLDDRKASIATIAPAFAALDEAEHVGRKVVVHGEVSDTNTDKRRLYRRLAVDASKVADLVVLVGRWAHHGLRAQRDAPDTSFVALPSVPVAADYLRSQLRAGDLVLVKGSHVYEHLARVALQFDRTVLCRRESCRRHMDCENCALLDRPAPTGPIGRARERLTMMLPG